MGIMDIRCNNCDAERDSVFDPVPDKCPVCGNTGKDWYTNILRMHPFTYDEMPLSDGRTLVFHEKLEFDFEILTLPSVMDEYGAELRKLGLCKDHREYTLEDQIASDKLHDEKSKKDVFIAVNDDLHYFTVGHSMEELCQSIPDDFEALWRGYADCLDNNPDILSEDAKDFGRELKALVKEIKRTG